MIIKQTIFLALAVASNSSAFAFTPGCTDTMYNTNTALSYRNYGGPHLYNVDGERIAISEVVEEALSPAKNRDSRQKKEAPIIINYDATLLDVDSDRTSLRTLLEPPAAPYIHQQKKDGVVLQTPEARQASLQASRAIATTSPQKRASPITSLYNIQDYQKHIIASESTNELNIIRFKAPWCQTCRTTNVAWERLATKLSKLSSSTNRIKFYSVELDGKEETTALKDSLGIEGVPQGILHHPTLGIVEQRIKLHRTNLSKLKKNLERFVTVTRGEDGLQKGMLLDGLREEE